MSRSDRIFYTVIGCAACIGVGMMVGSCIEGCVKRRDAVQQGVARWVADETGAATFEWVKCE
ncbi:hypothetical protein LCGC14_1129940 [marine sediment metagenome]|uniref:Uncharacterized protein n=1 Tax=marine sediment metagenome TaxID=412755 RepID=A0A0F9M1D2_9ZZZZ